MLEEFGISDDEIIPVCVMATMSSGKSTFLNSIFGEEILPEKNEACTAIAISVLNSSYTMEPRAYIIKNNGRKYAVDLYYPGTVSKINMDESIKDVLIVKKIPTIMNTNRSVVFVDTPGVNNSGDFRHGERTKNVLDNLKKGVIVYLMNATQLATTDDELLLQMVIDCVKKNSNLKLIFVLNKIDMLDEERESILDMMKCAVQYIKAHGIDDVNLYPLSAISAKVFRQKLNGKSLTKAEIWHMEQAYFDYKEESKSMLRYIDCCNDADEYDIAGEKVSKYSLRRVIENTGIVEIERQIERAILEIEQKTPQNINKFDSYVELEGVYSKKRKAKNFENYNGNVRWICRKCRQVNGEAQRCIHCKQPNVTWVKISD